jgi:hypothetical protein
VNAAIGGKLSTEGLDTGGSKGTVVKVAESLTPKRRNVSEGKRCKTRKLGRALYEGKRAFETNKNGDVGPAPRKKDERDKEEKDQELAIASIHIADFRAV